MSIRNSYIVMGSGMQGLAAAYDLILRGQASRLTLADSLPGSAEAGVRKLKRLLGPALKTYGTFLEAVSLNARHRPSLQHALQGHNAVLSALPYYLNAGVAEAAIQAGVHYCDLGGYFESTRLIMKLDARAKKADVALITDLGVAPGLCNSLAVCGMGQLTQPREVHIYCGGLPQVPRPPLGYKVVFNLAGVLGNYFGKSYVLKHGKVALVNSFSDREEIDFGKPLGTLEARTTGGATSTCPWTFQDVLDSYDYKTLRYPGHYEQIQLLKDLGLLDSTPVRVNGFHVAPRDLFLAAVGPRLVFPKDRDLLILRVRVLGKRDGKETEVVYDILDYGDPKTGFSAMQRTTGFSAGIVCAMLGQGMIAARGFVPVEKGVDGRFMLNAIRERGLKVTERIRSKP